MARTTKYQRALLALVPTARLRVDPKWGLRAGEATAKRVADLAGPLADPRLLTVSDTAPFKGRPAKEGGWVPVENEGAVALALRAGHEGWMRLAYGGGKAGWWVRERQPGEIRCCSVFDAEQLVEILQQAGFEVGLSEGTVVKVGKELS